MIALMCEKGRGGTLGLFVFVFGFFGAGLVGWMDI